MKEAMKDSMNNSWTVAVVDYGNWGAYINIYFNLFSGLLEVNLRHKTAVSSVSR